MPACCCLQSERLADSVLCAPMGSAAGSSGISNGAAAGEHSASLEDRPLPSPPPACLSEGDLCGLEVVGLHCLQGLSQEGSLEGFALPRPRTLPSVAEEEAALGPALT